MKYKSVALALIMCAVISITACGKETNAEPESTESVTAAVEVKDNTTIERGILLVGINSNSSPYISKDEEGKVEGFEIDLMKAIGELTMLDVKFVEMEYKDIYAELDVSSFDCVISAVQLSYAIDKVYDFSAPYYKDDIGYEYGIVVKSGNNRLLNVLNKSIAILKDNGTMDELYDKWFVDESETETQSQKVE